MESALDCAGRHAEKAGDVLYRDPGEVVETEDEAFLLREDLQRRGYGQRLVNIGFLHIGAAWRRGHQPHHRLAVRCAGVPPARRASDDDGVQPRRETRGIAERGHTPYDEHPGFLHSVVSVLAVVEDFVRYPPHRRAILGDQVRHGRLVARLRALDRAYEPIVYRLPSRLHDYRAASRPQVRCVCTMRA